MDGLGGDDQVFDDARNDTWLGRADNDFLHGGDDNNQTFALGGNDFVQTFAGADQVYREDGNDQLQGGKGDDFLRGICMKTKRLTLALIVLLTTCGVTWAGAEAYKLVLDKDKELCTGMLNLFNEDVRKYKFINSEKHKEFVRWEPLNAAGSSPCGQYWQSKFDINNDGADEIVIRVRSCLGGAMTDLLYIFPLTSDVLERLKEPDSQVLASAPDKVELLGDGGHWYALRELPVTKKDAPRPGIGGVLLLEPFVKGKTAYISMTDAHEEWIVIAKYLRGEALEDVCYLHGKSRLKP